ncbi:MAG: class E sortase [Propionibacteriaceae bacterium]
MSTRVRSRGRRRRKLSPLTVIGLALLVAGLGCLGYVAYQFFGTNVTSERAYTQEKTELRTQWQQQTKPTAKPSKGKATRKPAKENVVPGDAIALLRIPAFGSDYEVPILAGTDLDLLSRGVGHYSSTAQPGQIGNFALAGHRITHGEPFKRLLELDKGDQVIVETRDQIYTYVIDEAPKSLTVKSTASWVLDPVPGEEGAQPTEALITLTTCQDLFHSPDRSIGFGHLASTKNKG